jgi:hypothetical protein
VKNPIRNSVSLSCSKRTLFFFKVMDRNYSVHFIKHTGSICVFKNLYIHNHVVCRHIPTDARSLWNAGNETGCYLPRIYLNKNNLTFGSFCEWTFCFIVALLSKVSSNEINHKRTDCERTYLLNLEEKKFPMNPWHYDFEWFCRHLHTGLFVYTKQKINATKIYEIF